MKTGKMPGGDVEQKIGLEVLLVEKDFKLMEGKRFFFYLVLLWHAWVCLCVSCCVFRPT